MCKLDSQPNVEKLKSALGIGWYVYPIELNTNNKNKAELSAKTRSQLFCIHCLSRDIVLTGYDNYNTVNGHSSEWVYTCNDCCKSMTIVNE